MSEKEMCEKAQKQFEERGHHAVLVTETKDITVIDWLNKDNGSNYYVRYILSRTSHRQNLYLSGDLGDAVFEMFWNKEEMTIPEIARMKPEHYISYFHGKMQCGSDEWDFDYEETEKDLHEHLDKYVDVDEEEGGDGEIEYNGHTQEDIDNVIYDAMEDFNSITGFGTRAYDIVSEIDCDCGEWLGHCGRSLDFRIYLWIVGLIMACRQLSKTE